MPDISLTHRVLISIPHPTHKGDAPADLIWSPERHTLTVHVPDGGHEFELSVAAVARFIVAKSAHHPAAPRVAPHAERASRDHRKARAGLSGPPHDPDRTIF